MLLATKLLLGPVLLVQGTRVRRTALRLPEAEGPRSGRVEVMEAMAAMASVDPPAEPADPLERAASTEPLRLLFVGDSSAAGVGVTHQSQAWAEPTARLLAEQLARPVQWRLIAQSGLNTREALALFEAQPAEPADALITALGVNDVTSQKSPREFVADTLALHDCVALRTGATRRVLMGIPPMGRFTALPQPLRWYLGRQADALDRALRAQLAGDANIRCIPLDDPVLAAVGELAEDGYHPGPRQYRAMAEVTAREVCGLLRACVDS